MKASLQQIISIKTRNYVAGFHLFVSPTGLHFLTKFRFENQQKKNQQTKKRK